eukprot:773688_1
MPIHTLNSSDMYTLRTFDANDLLRGHLWSQYSVIQTTFFYKRSSFIMLQNTCGQHFDPWLPRNTKLLQCSQYYNNKELYDAIKNNDLLTVGYCHEESQEIPLEIANCVSQFHLHLYPKLVTVDGSFDIYSMDKNSGYILEAVSSFPTVRSDVFVQKQIGKYYYEFIVDSIGSGSHLGQIGWIDDKSVPDNNRLSGVGDDCHSWAYDGGRVKKWHNGRSPYGKRWNVCDVVGCCVDITADKTFDLTYYLNGECLGIAFKDCTYSGNLYAAFSTQRRRTNGKMVFDKEDFQFMPDGYQPILL